MELVIREVQLSEIELVATFLSNQFEKECKRLRLKQNKIIQLLTQAMKCEQCFIAVLDEKLIGVITYSTVEQASFEINFKQVRNILGPVKATLFYWSMMKSNLFLKPNQIYLNSLAVNPLFRRQGIATQLIQFILNQQKVDEYVLEVISENTPAINLYQKLGFEIISSKKDSSTIRIRRQNKILMKYNLRQKRIKKAQIEALNR
ncbi:MAG: GNAT family N-acetyltransferase [Turicibacter sp.]|nr:GNAT family N-acetyltransferase [Turicibacter sp.]